MGSRTAAGLKTSEGALQEAVDKVTRRPYALTARTMVTKRPPV